MAAKASRQAFGEALAEAGAENKDIVVLDADLSKSTMTKLFAAEFPDRFYEFGIAESNMILFNGVPLEDLIDEARVEMTPCASCSCITGTDASCRAIVCGEETYEEVPADLILKAAMKVVEP